MVRPLTCWNTCGPFVPKCRTGTSIMTWKKAACHANISEYPESQWPDCQLAQTRVDSHDIANPDLNAWPNCCKETPIRDTCFHDSNYPGILSCLPIDLPCKIMSYKLIKLVKLHDSWLLFSVLQLLFPSCDPCDLPRSRWVDTPVVEHSRCISRGVQHHLICCDSAVDNCAGFYFKRWISTHLAIYLSIYPPKRKPLVAPSLHLASYLIYLQNIKIERYRSKFLSIFLFFYYLVGLIKVWSKHV